MKLIIDTLKEIQHLETRLLPAVIVVSIATAFSPFVNIFFSAKLLGLFTVKAPIIDCFCYIAIALILNFVLFFLESYFGDVHLMYRSLMHAKELQCIAEKLFNTEYQKLEDVEFKDLIHKHTEAQERVFSGFTQLIWMVRDFIIGLLTVIVSLIIIFPLIKQGFLKTGESFFEKPIFLLTIIFSIIVIIGLVLIISLKMNKAWFKANDEYSKLNKLFYYFLNMFDDYKTGKEIRLYNEQPLIENLATKKILFEGEKILKKASFNSAKSSSIVAILGSIVGFGVYLFIAIKGSYNLFEISDLVLYCASFMQIINGMMKMAITFGKTEEILPMVKYYFEIINTKDELVYGKESLDISKEIEIEFRNVSFKYPNCENYSLKNVSFKIRNNEHIAIVGKNGSGKTTLIKLLCRFYDVTSGEILINQKNIKTYAKNELLSLVSVVFQDYKIYSTTVASNISASEHSDKQRIFEVLENVHIKNRVLRMYEKENSYLYKNLNSKGIEISGGEAQKLALARALYKDSALLILDEPTAALDPLAEYELYTEFNVFANHKTSIYISHRLSSCIFCDKIAVFDKGQLLEYDSHKNLLNQKDSYYKKLWETQASYYL